VYECPVCANRYLGDQSCDECGVFAVGSDLALRAPIATNRWRLSICWTHFLHLIARSNLAVNDNRSTGLLDRRPQFIEHILVGSIGQPVQRAVAEDGVIEEFQPFVYATV